LRGNPNAGNNPDNPNRLTLDYTQSSGGQYSACPDTLVLDHIAYGARDLVVEQIGDSTSCNAACYGGSNDGTSCSANSDCTGGGKCLQCPVTTNLTLAPCSEDIENLVPSSSTVNFDVWDEYEVRFSASLTVDCWFSGDLNKINSQAFVSTMAGGALDSFSAHTRIRPNPGAPGVLGVAEETRHDTVGSTAYSAVAAYNIHGEGNRLDGSQVVDTINLPQP
jgi:hypothetical protein